MSFQTNIQAAAALTAAPASAADRTLILMHCLGWQGGTVHQVIRELNTTMEEIWDSTSEGFLALRDKALAKSAGHPVRSAALFWQ